MNETPMDDELLEDVFSGDDIFTNDEAAEGLKKQAEAMGLDPSSFDINKEQKVLYARKSCRNCFGKGVLTFVPSPARPKKTRANADALIEKTVRKSRRFKGPNGKLKRKPTQKRIKIITEMPGNALDEVWNTRKPEPTGMKVELKQHLPCRCVRALEM